jgi:hypothetical protein
MKPFLLIASIALLLVGCASRDTRIEGRWKSNRTLTMATMDGWKPPHSAPLSPRKRALLASLFGKLIVTYDHGILTAEMPSFHGLPPYHHSDRYRIVASDEGSLAYLSTSPMTNKPEISHVYFDGPNRYWIYVLRTSTKEYFDRLTP